MWQKEFQQWSFRTQRINITNSKFSVAFRIKNFEYISACTFMFDANILNVIHQMQFLSLEMTKMKQRFSIRFYSLLMFIKNYNRKMFRRHLTFQRHIFFTFFFFFSFICCYLQMLKRFQNFKSACSKA